MANTPDYNNGLWHGWNGGECPVHPETVIQGLEGHGVGWTEAYAKDNHWESFRGAFRVTKEHKEPQEYWLCYKSGYRDRILVVKPKDYAYDKVTHVREVT